MSEVTLCLAPGLNNTSAVFDKVIARMPAGIRCHSTTFPALTTVEALADHFLSVMPPKFWLCGFSLGGYVGLSVLEKAPERVEGFILLCSSTVADSPAQVEARLASARAVEAGDYVALIAAQAANAFTEEGLKNQALLDARNAMLADYGRDRFLAHLTAARTRKDRTDVLRRYAGPKLVVAASDDRLFTVEHLRTGVAAATGSDFALIEHSGHLAPLERPDAVARTIGEWLGRKAL